MSWRNTKEYKWWKNKCKHRDGHRCALTGHTKRLEVHHFNHATFFPEERLDIDNGITLTRSVHAVFHLFIMGGYRKKCTRKDWDRYVRLFKYIIQISKILKL